MDLKECLEASGDHGKVGGDAFTITHQELSSTDHHKPLKCPECGKGFASQTGRQRHMKNHHPDKLPPPSAPKTPKQPSNRAAKENTKKEFYAVYGVIKDVVNHVCGEKMYGSTSFPGSVVANNTFPGAPALDPLSMTDLPLSSTKGPKAAPVQQRSVIERPYSCPDCGKAFASKQYMRKHQKVQHGDVSPGDQPTTSFVSEHQCPVCERCFTSNIILAIHAGRSGLQVE